MRTLLRILIIALAITAAAAMSWELFQVGFGIDNYWNNHGILFLVAITIFPRLTLLFSSVATGGLFWWLAWLFAPRVLVAVLATVAYWNANPVLVIAAWLIALGGEGSEKYVVVRQTGPNPRGFRNAKWVRAE